MKTRQGFVSNSSSSSFVILVTLAQHKKILKSLEDWERDLLTEMQHRLFKEVNIGDKNYLMYHEFGTNSFPPINHDYYAEEKAIVEKYKITEKIVDICHDSKCPLHGIKIESDYCPKCGACQSYIQYKHHIHEAIQHYYDEAINAEMKGQGVVISRKNS